jgi:hypothetical protein
VLLPEAFTHDPTRAGLGHSLVALLAATKKRLPQFALGDIEDWSSTAELDPASCTTAELERAFTIMGRMSSGMHQQTRAAKACRIMTGLYPTFRPSGHGGV